MTWWEAVVLGLVQGLTEFLPISSSAHLRVVGDLLPGLGDPGAAFTAITQIGTEAAVILYFRHDIVRIVRAWVGSLAGRVPRSDHDARMGWYVILGSVPIVVLGLAFQDAIEGVARNLWLTAAMLAGFGLLLGYADRVSKQRLTLTDLGKRHAVIFGLAQSLALIPGVSRSGGTITAGLLMGYTREAAARYSFLLAIPAVLGSGFYQLAKSGGSGGSAGALATAVATVVAFGVAYVVIVWFLRIISTHTFWPFVAYRLGFALVIVVLLLAGVVDAVDPAVVAAGP
jgi:undecaprenyl-diphosphatase